MFSKKFYYYFTFAFLTLLGLAVSIKNNDLIYPKNRYICLKNEYSPPKQFIAYTVAWCFDKNCKHQISKTINSRASELINHKLQFNQPFYFTFTGRVVAFLSPGSGDKFQGYSNFINLRWADDEGKKSQMLAFKNAVKEDYCTEENTYYFWKEPIPNTEKTRIVLKTLNQL